MHDEILITRKIEVSARSFSLYHAEQSELIMQTIHNTLMKALPLWFETFLLNQARLSSKATVTLASLWKPTEFCCHYSGQYLSKGPAIIALLFTAGILVK